MRIKKNGRGFETVVDHTEGADVPILQQSSAIGDYPDSLDRPGSSYLWVRGTHHLNREQVAELVGHLSSWLKTGSLQP